MPGYKYQNKILQLFKKHHLLGFNEVCLLLPAADSSTVYRNLDRLATDGVLKRVVISKHRVKYELHNQFAHHDHFVCLNCDQVLEVQLPTPKLKNLKVVDVMLRGYCSTCLQ